ncbi:MAG: hypothetical protein ACTSP9_07240 [Promethearchaeota archaeon]
MNEFKLSSIKSNGLKIYEAIFNKKKNVKIDEIEYPVLKFSSGIKFVDFSGYRFIQQNHNKKSEWGKKARQGHQIMWILKGRRYLARIMDGEFTDLKKDKE